MCVQTMFRMNGRCGFVLKPVFMRPNPSRSSTAPAVPAFLPAPLPQVALVAAARGRSASLENFASVGPAAAALLSPTPVQHVVDDHSGPAGPAASTTSASTSAVLQQSSASASSSSADASASPSAAALAGGGSGLGVLRKSLSLRARALGLRINAGTDSTESSARSGGAGASVEGGPSLAVAPSSLHTAVSAPPTPIYTASPRHLDLAASSADAATEDSGTHVHSQTARTSTEYAAPEPRTVAATNASAQGPTAISTGPPTAVATEDTAIGVNKPASEQYLPNGTQSENSRIATPLTPAPSTSAVPVRNVTGHSHSVTVRQQSQGGSGTGANVGTQSPGIFAGLRMRGKLNSSTAAAVTMPSGSTSSTMVTSSSGASGYRGTIPLTSRSPYRDVAHTWRGGGERSFYLLREVEAKPTVQVIPRRQNRPCAGPRLHPLLAGRTHHRFCCSRGCQRRCLTVLSSLLA